MRFLSNLGKRLLSRLMGLALIGGGFWLLYLAFLLPNAWVGVIGGIAILAGTSTLTFFKRL